MRLPDLTGRTALVTGANSGIGLPTALELTKAGAHVIVTVRDDVKGAETVARIRPHGSVEFVVLDLADLGSVRAVSRSLVSRLDRLDLLVNNAGIAMIPRRLTADGFEMQFGTNHLGHFALTGLLAPLLLAAPGSRVVTVASDSYVEAELDFDDLDSVRTYGRMSTYARSKLANLLFATELHRRATAAGLDLTSVAVHPGTTATNIATFGILTRPMNAIMRMFLQPPEKGAVPTLYAATAPGVLGGRFYGPGPAQVDLHPKALDEQAARRLWDVSAARTGVGFEVLVR
ncbi:oxidoreductase [Streptosporangium sp. DT93]|uniref:oxidoreductase n=1 Tax=Streptosporangium sp. DT93 TaxID=3393428 RepID=UPI003CF684B5